MMTGPQHTMSSCLQHYYRHLLHTGKDQTHDLVRPCAEIHHIHSVVTSHEIIADEGKLQL
jgi:hypothetical protein